jgi:MFS family permease
MFIATIPSVLWIDRVGRKPILIIGAIGMATCHIIIAVIVAKDMYQWSTESAAGWAAVCMVWLFVIHFGYSWGPCAWIIVAEIWPLSSRPYGVSLGASSNWMNNFIVGQVTPDMLNGITYGTYILFGLLTYMGAGFIYFFVPETKRLTLEEMVSVLLGDVKRDFLMQLLSYRISSSVLKELLRPTSSAWRPSTVRSVSPSCSVVAMELVRLLR